MSKKVKITIIAVVSVVLLIAIVAMILLVPRTGKSSDVVWSAGDTYDVNSVARLDKTKGEDFKILLITDLQLWAGLGDNKRAWEIVDQLVEETKPDLIIMPGDNVSGLNTDILTLQVVDHMEKYGIPWAPVFGNHDAEGNATLEWQGDKYENAEHCLFSKGPKNLYGVGNYFINIFDENKPVYSLALFDNGRYYDYGGDIGKKEIYMGYEQIAWYEWNMKGINDIAGYTVPSMAFSHFAPPEFREAMEKYGVKNQDDGRIYVPEELGYGSCAYLPGVAPVNSGFIERAKAMGLTHVFVGHDHENDASITYEGITYTYGLKTGPSPAPWNNALEYGGTVITIGDNGAVDVTNKVICKA